MDTINSVAVLIQRLDALDESFEHLSKLLHDYNDTTRKERNELYGAALKVYDGYKMTLANKPVYDITDRMRNARASLNMYPGYAVASYRFRYNIEELQRQVRMAKARANSLMDQELLEAHNKVKEIEQLRSTVTSKDSKDESVSM